MRGYLCFVILIICSLRVLGQDSTATINRFYLQWGSTLPMFSSEKLMGHAALISEVKNKLVVGLRFYATEFQDPNYPAQRGMLCWECITHTVTEYNVSVGKVNNVNRSLAFILTAGPSFVHYAEPVNIRRRSTFFSTIYDYDKKIHNTVGFSFRLDSNFFPFRFFGLSVGGLYNYNRQVPNGGITISFLLGKLKNKKANGS